MSGNQSKKESKITKIDFDALKKRIITVLDNIKNEDIGIDQIEDTSYMEDMGGMKVFESIKARNGQYDNSEMGVALKQHDEAFLTIKSLREKEKIEEIRNNKKEKAKEIIVSDLKEGQDRRQNRVQEIDKEIEKLEQDLKDHTAIRDSFKATRESIKLAIKNHPSDKEVYQQSFTDANKNTQKFMRKVRDENKKLKKLNDEKTELQEEYDKLEELIAEVKNETIELEKAEDPIIEPIDVPENGKSPEEILREQAKGQGEQAQGTPEQGAPAQGTPEQGAPAQGTPVQGTPAQGAPVQGTPAQGAPVQGTPVQGAPVQGTPVQGEPVQGTPAQGAPVQETSAQETPAQENKLRLEEVKFYIKDDGTPIYTVKIFNGDKEVEPFQIEGYDNIETMLTKRSVEHLKNYRIAEADKYFDRNIATLSERMKNITKENYPNINPELIEAYKELGASLWNDYDKMLADKKVLTMETKTREPSLKIDYDFSNLDYLKLDGSARETMNALRKIAKNNAKLGLATYEKAPSVLKRLYDKIRSQLGSKAKLIEAHSEEQQNTPEEPTQDNNLYIDALLEQYEKQLPKEEQDIKNYIIKTYREMNGEEGFMMEEFVKTTAENLGEKVDVDYVKQTISDWDKAVEEANSNGIRVGNDKTITPFQAERSKFASNLHFDTKTTSESEAPSPEPAKTQGDKAKSPEQPVAQSVASTDQEQR